MSKYRVTEILDVAPIDLLSALNSAEPFQVPDELIPAAAKAQAMDFKFHWVSERGPPEKMRMTSGIKLEPTVCNMSNPLQSRA